MIEKKSALWEKADAAFRAAARVVIQRAKQTKTPVIVWEDGRIKEIPCEQLEVPEGADPAENRSA